MYERVLHDLGTSKLKITVRSLFFRTTVRRTKGRRNKSEKKRKNGHSLASSCDMGILTETFAVSAIRLGCQHNRTADGRTVKTGNVILKKPINHTGEKNEVAAVWGSWAPCCWEKLSHPTSGQADME